MLCCWSQVSVSALLKSLLIQPKEKENRKNNLFSFVLLVRYKEHNYFQSGYKLWNTCRVRQLIKTETLPA